MVQAGADQHWIAGDPPIALTVRRSARARKVSLRVSRVDGQVTLTLPKGARLNEGLAFADERADWIRRHLADLGPVAANRPVAAFGMEIPLRGRPVMLVPGLVRFPVEVESRLILPSGADRVGARVKAFLKATARDALVVAADTHASTLGRGYGRLTLRDTRGRWGSCSSRGDLMFSWRLIMAPEAVLDYVAAHEVAHLVEMNHSPAFWAVVAELCPDHEAARGWLRRHGAGLHALRLTD